MQEVHAPPFFVDTGLYGAPGDRLYIVVDTLQEPCLATVTKTRDDQQATGGRWLHFSYVGWPSRWDEWIESGSDRISSLSENKVNELVSSPHLFPHVFKSAAFGNVGLKYDILDGLYSENDVRSLIVLQTGRNKRRRPQAYLKDNMDTF